MAFWGGRIFFTKVPEWAFFIENYFGFFFHSTLALHNNSTLQSVSPGFFQPLNLPYFGVGSSSFTKMLPYSLK